MANEFKVKNGIKFPDNTIQTTAAAGSGTSSLVSGTAVNSTSGTTIDFTSIPSWVKRVTVMFSAVSTSGTSSLLVQIGDSGGIETTGYDSYALYAPSSGGFISSTSGYVLEPTGYLSGTIARYGMIVLANLTGNNWVASSNLYEGSGGVVAMAAGGKTLSAVLDRVRVTTVNGTDTFDGGTINILYEGGGVGGTLDSITDVSAPAPSNGQALVWNSTTSQWEAQTVSGGGGTGISWSKKTSNYTASSGDFLLTDTGSGSFTVTLPSSPTTGNFVVVADANDWKTNNLIIARNGSTIEGLSEDLYLNIKGIQVSIIFDGTTWEVFAFAAPSIDITNDTSTNTTQYLTMSRATSGALNGAYVSNSGLTFNPSTGTLSSTNYNSLSDKNLKKNIQPLEDYGFILDQLNPVKFQWKSNDKTGFGLIAQEVEKVLPEIVEDNDTYKTVSYQQLIPFLLACVKQQQKELEELKEIVNGNIN
jgi:hypothetical protein